MVESRRPEMSRASLYGGRSPIRPLRLAKDVFCVLTIGRGHSRFVYPAIRPVERTYSTDLYPFGNRSVWKLVCLEIDPFGNRSVWKARGHSRFAYPWPNPAPGTAVPWPNPAIRLASSIVECRPAKRTYPTDLYPFGNRSVWKLVCLEIDPFG